MNKIYIALDIVCSVSKNYQNFFLWSDCIIKKGDLNEAMEEFDVSSLYATAMTLIKISKGTPREINIDAGKVCLDNYHNEPGKH